MSTLILLGIAVTLVGFLWLLAVAFRVSAGWGIACLLISPVAIVFTLLNWNRAWKPFLIWIAGSAIIFAGLGSTMPEPEKMENMAAAQEEIQRRLESGEMTKEEAQQEMARMMTAIVNKEEYQAEFMQETDSNSQKGAAGSAEKAPGTRLLQQIQADKPPTASTSTTTTPATKPAGSATSPYQTPTREEMDSKVADAIREERKARAREYNNKKTRRKVLISVALSEADKHIGKDILITTKTGIERKGMLVDVTRDGLLIEKRRTGGRFSYTMAKKNVKTMLVESWVTE